jgi:hypothetical protein
MASSALQARDLRVREDRGVTQERWETKELSVGGQVSVESSGHACGQTAVAPFENWDKRSTELKCALCYVRMMFQL